MPGGCNSALNLAFVCRACVKLGRELLASVVVPALTTLNALDKSMFKWLYEGFQSLRRRFVPYQGSVQALVLFIGL